MGGGVSGIDVKSGRRRRAMPFPLRSWASAHTYGIWKDRLATGTHRNTDAGFTLLISGSTAELVGLASRERSTNHLQKGARLCLVGPGVAADDRGGRARSPSSGQPG